MCTLSCLHLYQFPAVLKVTLIANNKLQYKIHVQCVYCRVRSVLVQVTKLPSGLVVASLEDCAPVSSVSVFIRAGSRFEPAAKQGLTHLLRTCAYQVERHCVCACVCVCVHVCVHACVCVYERES